jgi:hypothetical protein
MNVKNLGKLIRYVVVAAGGAGVAVSDDVYVQIASGILAAAQLAYSIYKDRNQN